MKKSIKIKKYDVILTQNYEVYENYKLKGKCYFIDNYLSSERVEISDVINQIFSQLPQELSVFKNDVFTRIFLPSFSIIEQISKIIENEGISEIVLLEGSEHLFKTVEYGEGEGVKKFYKSSWLLNKIIGDYFKGSLKICLYKKIDFYYEKLKQNKE